MGPSKWQTCGFFPFLDYGPSGSVISRAKPMSSFRSQLKCCSSRKPFFPRLRGLSQVSENLLGPLPSSTHACHIHLLLEPMKQAGIDLVNRRAPSPQYQVRYNVTAL